jgi:WD40 repeat protein
MRLRHGGDVYAVTYSPDGKLLASAGDDGMIHLWEAATGKEVRPLRGHRNRVRCLAFSPDGTRLASGSSDGRIDDRSVRLWDVATGKELFHFPSEREIHSVTNGTSAPPAQTQVHGLR